MQVLVWFGRCQCQVLCQGGAIPVWQVPGPGVVAIPVWQVPVPGVVAIPPQLRPLLLSPHGGATSVLAQQTNSQQVATQD